MTSLDDPRSADAVRAQAGAESSAAAIAPWSSALRLDRATPYRELRDPPLPEALREHALACFAAQRNALPRPYAPTAEETPRSGDTPADLNEAALEAVSPHALEQILASGRTVGGIVTQRDVATAIPFNARHARGVVWSGDVAQWRRRVDSAVARWIRTLFVADARPILSTAGQWWYPPETYFGWHTNQGYPGWRLYLSYAEEPGRSFFRFRHPISGEIVTSPDAGWDLRLFEVSADRPLWHAIYSDTHRYSIGWFVRPWSLRNAAAAGVKQAIEHAARWRHAASATLSGERIEA